MCRRTLLCLTMLFALAAGSLATCFGAEESTEQAKLNANLIAAVKRGDAHSVRLLLAKGASPNAHDKYRKIDPEVLQYTDVVHSNRRTGIQPASALMTALGTWSTDDKCVYDQHKINTEIVKALVNAGANVNEHEADNMSTPLMVAVCNADITVVNYLLKHNAKVNAYDKIKRTPLIYAVFCYERDNSKVVDLLLHNGANPDIMTVDGDRALTVAAGRGDKQYVRLLAHYGANFNAVDNKGLSIINHVKRNPIYQRNVAIYIALLRYFGAK